MMKNIILIIFFILYEINLYALFENNLVDAKTISLANSIVSLENPFSYRINPSLAGSQREYSLTLSHTKGSFTDYDESKYKSINLDLLFPSRYKIYNVTYFLNYSSIDKDLIDEKKLSFGLGTFHFLEWGNDSFDFGFNIKKLGANFKDGISQNKIGLDIGSILRREDLNIGFSILNLNAPKFLNGLEEEKAGRSLIFGISQKREDYSMNASLIKRNVSQNTYSLNTGIEYFFKTYNYGTLSTSLGLSAGNDKSFFSFGLGQRKMSYEFLYSMAIPLNGPFNITNSFSFVFRFQNKEEESEYQRLIQREMKYRKDLLESLNESESREKKLRKEMLSMKEEIDDLKLILNNEKLKRNKIEEIKNNLNNIIEKHKKSEEELRLITEKRELLRKKQLEENFNLDWESYLKLKNSGASRQALKDYLEKIIIQYQDKGIDISIATLEIQKILKN